MYNRVDSYETVMVQSGLLGLNTHRNSESNTCILFFWPGQKGDPSSSGTCLVYPRTHYSDVIMGTIASQITSLTIVYSIVYSDADQRKHQSSASLVFVRRIHRGPVNSPHKWPVTRKCFHLMTSSVYFVATKVQSAELFAVQSFTLYYIIYQSILVIP